MINHTFMTHERLPLIEHLERDPEIVPAFAVSLTTMIAELIDETFAASDPAAKT